MSAPVPDRDDGDSVLDELVRTLSQQISATGWVDAELQRQRDAGEPILNIFDLAAGAAAASTPAVESAATAALSGGGGEQSGTAAEEGGETESKRELASLEGQLAELSAEMSAIDSALKTVVLEQALNSASAAEADRR